MHAFTKRSARPRKGAVIPLVALLLIPMVAFLALAIDIGMMCLARTETQDVADAVAISATRGLTGNAPTYGTDRAATTVTTVLGKSKVIGLPVAASQVSTRIGQYLYNSTQTRFEGSTTLPSNTIPTLVESTVSFTYPNTFGKVIGTTNFTINTQAVAVHRPRDSVAVIDFSGSMRFGSTLGQQTSDTATIGDSQNGDPRVPVFGHYGPSNPTNTVDLFATSNWVRPDTLEVYGVANVTSETESGPAIIDDFHTTSANSNTPGFTAQPGSLGTTPNGDTPLKANRHTGTSYASCAAELFGLTTGTVNTTNATKRSGTGSNTYADAFETSGYDSATIGTTATFKGYTQGPGHWGKTFFIWPPDPRASKDWRRLYFNYATFDPNTGDINARLYTTAGAWRSTGSTSYTINYQAVIDWIRANPNPFPASLRCGRLIYYSAIPTTLTSSPSTADQQFWKQYIDHVIVDGGDAETKYSMLGGDYSWGNFPASMRARPTGTNASYMDYRDNPKRPRDHFWFGGLTMMDFIDRKLGLPGACHESQLWQLKAGINATLVNFGDNAPNDLLALSYFAAGSSYPKTRAPLSRKFQDMIDALWLPTACIGNSNEYNAMTSSGGGTAQNNDAPRATGSTCPSGGLTLAFNQFSCEPSLVNYNSGAPAGQLGGNGRRGAQKLCIIVTDGVPNNYITATFVNQTNSRSYYKTQDMATPGVTSTGNNDATACSKAVAVVTQMAQLEANGGFATASRPVKMYCIGFGDLFDPVKTADQTKGNQGRAFLLSLQKAAGTSKSTDSAFPETQVIYGDTPTRLSRLQTVLTTILQDGVQVSLIK